jgi:hypothetical protein
MSNVSSAARVAVVTPYDTELREVIQRNMESVRAQTHPADHILIADGSPQDGFDSAPRCLHLRLPVRCGDCGDTPRSVGIAFACSLGYDAITLLDADCELSPDAVATCLRVAEESRVALVVGRRLLVRPDGTPLPVQDDTASLHIDTNCYFFLRPAFRVLLSWALIPPPFHVVDDRVIRVAVAASGVRFALAQQTTVVYPTRWESHYARSAELPPANAKRLEPALVAAAAQWQALDDKTRRAYCDALGFAIPLRDALQY